MAKKIYDSKICIYLIKNLINNKVYIGSTKDVKSRKANHFSQLNSNTHKNLHLQRSFNKYGRNNFSFHILEYLNSENDLYKKEAIWINNFNSLNYKFGYNKQNIDLDSSKIKLNLNQINALKEKGKKEMTKEKLEKMNEKVRRKVCQYDLNNNFIKEYNSITEAAKFIGGQRSKINMVCLKKPKFKTYKKYIWRYKDEEQI